ncbi:hypothetical protein C2E21_7991 [Chlorella sorokiniana]|uniref:Uncharacterized protein n=1 Tax=Chlorella sorokiniana TaxID=3076 RepID=A0A2P6TG19_CHLSO|nr:hypothetical protein C2E21_7991 [Chlorella sorokiniana]|eukprot:PRW33062.1 hypothetical protein C2E21_7991 [Chlorella sorokiniana]
MDAIELYAATLGEVKRQAAQLGGTDEAAGDGSGGSSSDSSGGWVVLESRSTPPSLPGAAGCSLWPQQQWRIAYEILFCQCPPEVAALRPHQDDMLFFVYTDEAAAAARARLFVRRRQARAAALPPDLQLAPTSGASGSTGSRGGSKAGPASSSKAAQVDWRASVLLMVVLQTAYRLSLVTSPDADLLNAFVEDGGSSAAAGTQSGTGAAAAAAAARVHQVTQAVHPSPSRVPVNLDHSRSDAGQPKESYPDICFAVDSCDHAFRSQVLRLPGDCYCVLLHADVASSWRMPALPPSSSGGGGGAAGDTDAAAVAAAERGMAALGLSQSGQRPSSGSLPGGSAASSSGSMHSAHGSPVQARPQSVVAFSGYVGHHQLTAALGSQLAGDPVRQVLRAAAAAARGKQRDDAILRAL